MLFLSYEFDMFLTVAVFLGLICSFCSIPDKDSGHWVVSEGSNNFSAYKPQNGDFKSGLFGPNFKSTMIEEFGWGKLFVSSGWL